MKKSLLLITIIFTFSQLIQAQENNKKIKWDYTNITPKTFIFNKTIVGYFIEENKDSPRINLEIFSDSTATTKISSIKLNEILPTEVFDVLAYSYYDKLYLIKSSKDKKIYLIHEDVMYYQNWGKGDGATLTTKYTNPQVIAQKKIALDSYRLKLNGALSTVSKLEAIHSKHTYNQVNKFGTVVGKVYKVEEFTPQEKITYKQLILKLEKQKNTLDEDLAKKIGNNETVRDLLENIDIKKQLQVEHSYTDYSYYALEW